jgi:hypothetical protein
MTFAGYQTLKQTWAGIPISGDMKVLRAAPAAQLVVPAISRGWPI